MMPLDPNRVPIPPLVLEYLQRPGMAHRLRRMGLNYTTAKRLIDRKHFPDRWRGGARCYDLVATVLEEAAGAHFDEITERQD